MDVPLYNLLWMCKSNTLIKCYLNHLGLFAAYMALQSHGGDANEPVTHVKLIDADSPSQRK